MDLLQLQQNLLSIDVWELLKPILNNYLEDIEELNRKQLSEGLLANGESTPSHSGGKMSEIYVDNKIERGVYPEPLYPLMNFYNTGDFYRSITAYLDDAGIMFESNDEKALELESKYSSYLMGLTQESLSVLTSKIGSELIESLYGAILKN